MRKTLAGRAMLSFLLSALTLSAILTPNPTRSLASSHREAPLIVADPLADNTDTYAFRSTESGRSGFVTLIANWIPFQEPSGGPHFYKFDDTVLYEIYVDNTGDGVEDITYQFRFKTRFKNPDSVLGMAAPNQALAGTGGIEPLITSLDDPDYNEPQTYSVTRIDRHTGKRGAVIASWFGDATKQHRRTNNAKLRDSIWRNRLFIRCQMEAKFLPVNAMKVFTSMLAASLTR